MPDSPAAVERALRFAVILTHNRPDALKLTAAATAGQVNRMLIIDNASDPLVRFGDFASPDWPPDYTSVWRVTKQPPNLSEMWGLGLRWARTTRERMLSHPDPVRDVHTPWDPADPWYVAFLCDDAPPPAGWMEAVTQAMRASGAAIGASAPEGPAQKRVGPPGSVLFKDRLDRDPYGRMPGWAFVLDGRSSVEPDPQFQWWWGDTDMDWQARHATYNGDPGPAGMVLINTHPVPNLKPNDFTASKPELGARVGLDRLAFEAKWGAPAPW